MGTGNFNDDFKRDAVAQITERGCPAKEVSKRLGVNTHSLYAWKRKLAKMALGDTDKDTEILGLMRELARVSEERDTLKNGEPWPRSAPRGRTPPPVGWRWARPAACG